GGGRPGRRRGSRSIRLRLGFLWLALLALAFLLGLAVFPGLGLTLFSLGFFGRTGLLLFLAFAGLRFLWRRLRLSAVGGGFRRFLLFLRHRQIPYCLAASLWRARTSALARGSRLNTNQPSTVMPRLRAVPSMMRAG